jgi:hypothetical protein
MYIYIYIKRKKINEYKNKPKINKFKSYLIRMSELHNDSEPKSTSKESSYLDKNKENHDNSSADEDENCLKTPKAAKKRGRNKTYEI